MRGHDLVLTPRAAQSQEPASGGACAAACCGDAPCVAWTWVPAAPSDFGACVLGSPCCYLKDGVPSFSPSGIPGIASGLVDGRLDGLATPALGMRSAVPLGGMGAGALELRADGTVHEVRRRGGDGGMHNRMGGGGGTRAEQVTIMNASPAGAAKQGVLADMMAAVRVVGAAGAVTRVVRTAAPDAARAAGVAGVDAITYSGSYPVSRLVRT